jgi:hypothetical protein
VEIKIPVNAVEIIFLAPEINVKIFAENISYLVESFQATVIIYNGFGTAKGDV